MAAQALNSSGNELTDVAEEFEKLCFNGDLNDTDRRILRFIFANPRATHEEIADAVGYSRSGVSRRLNRVPFIQARMLFEGTVTEKMQRIVFKLARNVEKIMDEFDDAKDPIDAYREATNEGISKETAELIAKAAIRNSDPRTMLDAGKVAVTWVAKQAELDLLAKSQNARPEDLPTLEEARRILAEDPAAAEEIEVEVEDL